MTLKYKKIYMGELDIVGYRAPDDVWDDVYYGIKVIVRANYILGLGLLFGRIQY